jgi:hypothetical protein
MAESDSYATNLDYPLNITLYTAHPSLFMVDLLIVDSMEADQTKIDWTNNGFITGNCLTLEHRWRHFFVYKWMNKITNLLPIMKGRLCFQIVLLTLSYLHLILIKILLHAVSGEFVYICICISYNNFRYSSTNTLRRSN